MTNILVIHGSFGHPKENWLPWLKSKLEKLKCKVFIPKFPTPKNQSLKNWLRVFRGYRKYLDRNSIVVGHSLGSAFLLNVLEGLGHPARAAFFISMFTKLPNNLEANKSFTDRRFDWEKIRQNCKRFYVFHSNNDPYVPLKKARKLAENLGVGVILVKNAGHFNERTGYTKFNLLLEKIKSELLK